MRKKTDSLTELSKEVAREVMHEAIFDHIDKNHMEGEKLQSGLKWSEEEDKMLYQEFTTFLHLAGMLHKRTPGAIKARVQSEIADWRLK